MFLKKATIDLKTQLKFKKMGGSKEGFFYKKSDPDEILKKIQIEKEKAQDDQFDSKITAIINDLLSDINKRDSDKIQKKLNRINSALESDIEGTIDLRYGGSVAKHTYVNGLSDIDMLALIDKSELKNKTPGEVKEYFYNRLKRSYPGTEIINGKLAVTLRFKDGVELQILPAIKSSDGFKIPSVNQENKWSRVVNPKKFALMLRAVNQKTNGKLIPTIKLVKSIMADLPESRRLSGYHVEALAINIFSNYKGTFKPKPMLKHFFNQSSSHVLTPIKDKTGQSTHVDDYLGAKESLGRKMVADSLSRIGRRMESADSAKLQRNWEELLK